MYLERSIPFIVAGIMHITNIMNTSNYWVMNTNDEFQISWYLLLFYFVLVLAMISIPQFSWGTIDITSWTINYINSFMWM